MGCQFSLKSSFYGWSQLPRRISRLEHTYFNKVCLNLSNWCSISVWLAWSVDVYQTWMSRNVEESRYVEKCREMSSFENFWWSVEKSRVMSRNVEFWKFLMVSLGGFWRCFGLGGGVRRCFGLGGAVLGWFPTDDFDITQRYGTRRNVFYL